MAKTKRPAAPSRNSRQQKVAIYIRVSTSHQVDKDSLPMQRKDLVAYSNLVLGIDDYVIFEDAGYSGKNTDRPDFQAMMSRIRAGEFSHVLVWKIDRISRNLLDFAEMYEELQRLRVVFVSKSEQFDTSNAMGEAMLKIILVFAELERNMTSERVTATMISRANLGQWNGGRVPFGYDYDAETNTFSINEEEAVVCRLIRDDYLKEHSLVHTAQYINALGHSSRAGMEWSPTTIWKIVSSPFYAGTYRYNRFKGTENRTVNPKEEWVLVPDHHPAIFTLDEHERMCAILEDNCRQKNSPGRYHRSKNTYVFQGLLYCGKCGHRFTASPGRQLADGYRTYIYSCPTKRKARTCDSPSVNDLVVGEFVINYILNILNAKSVFSSIGSPGELEKRLLRGSTFSDIQHIEPNGLNDLFNLLSRYGSDKSFSLSTRKSKKAKAAVDPEIENLRKEKDKQERAMKRLQELYLYSDNAMPEKDFIIRKKEISSRLDEINRKLGLFDHSALSDEDFIKFASHLLITKELKDREYIYYRDLVTSVSQDILKSYIGGIIDSIQLTDGHISSITFKNGLTHRFIYAATGLDCAGIAH